MRSKVLIFLTAMAQTCFFLSCQHISKKYCEDTNWRKEAFVVALQGENRTKFIEFQNQCKPFKVDLNQQSFDEGFDEGASQFCLSEAGREFGASGLIYKGTCEKHANEIDFFKNYKLGRLDFLKNQFDSKSKKLEESNARLWRKKNEFELESNTNPALAVNAYNELESYRVENERLKSEIGNLNAQIIDLETKN